MTTQLEQIILLKLQKVAEGMKRRNAAKAGFTLVSSPCIISADLVGVGVQVGDRFELGTDDTGELGSSPAFSTVNPNSRKVLETVSYKTGLPK